MYPFCGAATPRRYQHSFLQGSANTANFAVHVFVSFTQATTVAKVAVEGINYAFAFKNGAFKTVIGAAKAGEALFTLV